MLNPPSLQNDTTNMVIQQNIRKLPMMDILMSETCWAHKCCVKNSWIRSDASADAAQILRQHDASSVFRSKSGGTNFYRFLLIRQLHGQLRSHFDESQQAPSWRDRRPLTWEAVQIWGRLRRTFCLIWNAGTISDIAYGSNNPIHKPVATSEKSP